MSHPIIVPMPIRTGFSGGSLRPYSSTIEMCAAGCVSIFLCFLIIAVCIFISKECYSTTGKIFVWVVATPLIFGIFLIWAMFL